MSSGGVKKGSKVKIKHPPELDRRVVMRGVKIDVIKPWIAQRVTELLGVEDDVLIAMIYNFLEMDQVHQSGGDMYVQLLTFLEKNTALFMKVRAWSGIEVNERAPRVAAVRRLPPSHLIIFFFVHHPLMHPSIIPHNISDLILPIYDIVVYVCISRWREHRKRRSCGIC